LDGAIHSDHYKITMLADNAIYRNIHNPAVLSVLATWHNLHPDNSLNLNCLKSCYVHAIHQEKTPICQCSLQYT